MGIDDLTADMANNRGSYTCWLNTAMQEENLSKFERALGINR
jgi:hypothetical protein